MDDKGRPEPAEMKAAPLLRHCPSCAGMRPHRLGPLALTPDDPAYAGYSIAECESCGLHGSHPMPDREELRRWYVDGRGVPDDRPDQAGRVRRLWHGIHDHAMVRLVSRYAPGGTLLDVGAGSGRFVLAAASTGRWKLIATEYADETIATLRSRGIDARRGNIDEVEIGDRSVDAVWASHLMEHLPDLEGFLASVRRILAPRGVLVALVPSERSLRSRLGLSTWHHVNPPGHLWGFRPDTFASILRANGFAVELQREVHVICEMVTVARLHGR